MHSTFVGSRLQMFYFCFFLRDVFSAATGHWKINNFLQTRPVEEKSHLGPWAHQNIMRFKCLNLGKFCLWKVRWFLHGPFNRKHVSKEKTKRKHLATWVHKSIMRLTLPKSWQVLFGKCCCFFNSLLRPKRRNEENKKKNIWRLEATKM